MDPRGHPLRLDPDTTADNNPGRSTGLTADDLTRAWRSGDDDAADTDATAERWDRVLAVLEHRPAPDDLDW